MINVERRKRILEILEKESRVSTTDLQECLGVTGATVRSDLRDLEREGAIVRYHGGARISDSVKQSSNPENYMLRSVMSVAEKTAIGREAGKFVHEGETIFIDASSTTFHMIPFISNLDNLNCSGRSILKDSLSCSAVLKCDISIECISNDCSANSCCSCIS